MFVGINWIALARVNSRAATHIERQKERAVVCNARRHIHFLQVHCKVDDAPRLEIEQSRFRVSLRAVLQDCVLITLPRKIAFEFKRHNRKAVQENHKVDSLGIARPYFFHYGKDIFIVFGKKVFIEGRCGFGIHKV